MKSPTEIYILHGWAIDSNNEAKWVEIRQMLKSEHITTHFLGIPGLTTTQKSVWNIDDFINWLADQLPQHKVILLGHSFGGQLASLFAARHPERVEKLILVDSSGLRSHTWQKNLKRSVFKKIAFIGKLIAPFPIARKLLYKLAREKDYYQANQILRQTMSNVIEYEILSELPEIKAETLIVWGENDTATPVRLGRQFAEHISNSSFIIIPTARHSPQFTHPAEVTSIIKIFLTR